LKIFFVINTTMMASVLPSYEELAPRPWTAGYVHIIRYDYIADNAPNAVKFHVCHSNDDIIGHHILNIF
jgi:hypothetical protein